MEKKYHSVLKKPDQVKSKEWSAYLSESLLIIFSVVLGLLLTEYMNSLHEDSKTRGTLRNITAELKQNKKAIAEMKIYNIEVLRNIDSILAEKNLQKKLVSNSAFNLNLIAPQGVLYRYLNNTAWTMAKNNNVVSKLDIETVDMLTKVYEDQSRMQKVEDEIAKVVFDRASRDPNQVQTTLILIRDTYHGWAVDRTDGLLNRIDAAIAKLN